MNTEMLNRYIYYRAAAWFNRMFGFTCIPVIGKVPLVDWLDLKRPITADELAGMRTSKKNAPAWPHATGLLSICGVNDLTLIDGDNVTDEAMWNIADYLGLSNSKWRSGSPGRDWRHLWLHAPGLSDLIVVGKVDRDALPEFHDSSDDRHHVEIRHRGHYGVLPPSQHPKRPGFYKFADGWPDEPLPTVDPRALLAAYELVTVPKSETTREQTSATYKSTGSERAVHVARECLKRLALWRCDDYDAWIRVGMALCALGSDGLAMWDEWSKQSGKYDADICEKAWKYLTPDEGVTQASLTYWANQDDPRRPANLVSVGINAVELKKFLLPGDALNAIAGYAPVWGKKLPVTDRSEADWVAIKWLIKRGATDSQIVWVFKNHPIGQGKYAESDDSYLAETIAKARRKFKSMV